MSVMVTIKSLCYGSSKEVSGVLLARTAVLILQKLNLVALEG